MQAHLRTHASRVPWQGARSVARTPSPPPPTCPHSQVVAGIFGMNMRSMMENSIMGFWGVAGLIIFGCTFLFFTILRYTRRKRIL